MKTHRLCAKLASLLKPVLPAITGLAILGAGAGRAQAQDYADWEYEFAYTLGVQAYILGFPWVNLALLPRQAAALNATGPQSGRP